MSSQAHGAGLIADISSEFCLRLSTHLSAKKLQAIFIQSFNIMAGGIKNAIQAYRELISRRNAP